MGYKRLTSDGKEKSPVGGTPRFMVVLCNCVVFVTCHVRCTFLYAEHVFQLPAYFIVISNYT